MNYVEIDGVTYSIAKVRKNPRLRRRFNEQTLATKDEPLVSGEIDWVSSGYLSYVKTKGRNVTISGDVSGNTNILFGYVDDDNWYDAGVREALDIRQKKDGQFSIMASISIRLSGITYHQVVTIEDDKITTSIDKVSLTTINPDTPIGTTHGINGDVVENFEVRP